MSAEDAARQVELMREELRSAIEAGTLAAHGIEGRSITRAEILRGLLSAVNKTGGEHSTIRLSRNAKGDTQFEVSVRTGESDALATAADAQAEAVRLYRMLDELFPMLAKAAGDASS
ncbi:MAG: hypothetical protein L0221_14230 [Chloroflexi bacterium]|nr:hypothetical protein [Chloroflexota bacterium]